MSSVAYTCSNEENSNTAVFSEPLPHLSQHLAGHFGRVQGLKTQKLPAQPAHARCGDSRRSSAEGDGEVRFMVGNNNAY